MTILQGDCLDIMRGIKLLAPPGKPKLLDPFAGSGSTILAAIELGVEAIGIEKEPEYCEIARKRIEHWMKKEKQMDIFEGDKS
jgi:site-specific DNA-methyltransferase (adenine-specific)